VKGLGLQVTAIRTTLAALDAQLAAIEQELQAQTEKTTKEPVTKCLSCEGNVVSTATFNAPKRRTCVACGRVYGEDED